MDDRTLGHRTAFTACGGLSKTVGTERFNRGNEVQLNNPSVLRRWRTPCRIFLNARSPWVPQVLATDRKSTRLNSSHLVISYAVFCLKKKKKKDITAITPKH